MERRFDLLTRQIKTKFWATVWPYVRTDRANENRSAGWGFRENRAHMRGPLFPSKFCHMGYRSEIRYLAFVQGPLYLLLLYHTRAHLSSVFSKKNSEDFSPRKFSGHRRSRSCASHSSCNLPHRLWFSAHRVSKYDSLSIRRGRCNHHRGPKPWRSHRIRS